MRTHSPTAVRCGLIGVFAVLAVALLVPTVSAQFRPGQPGMPGGMPGMPNIPRPQFPPIQPPRFPDMPGMGGGLGGLGGIPETVYYCKKCKTELGRGMFPPASATCRCGLTYNNGMAFDNGQNNRPFGGGPDLQPPLNPPFNPNPNRVPPAQPVNLPNAGVPDLQPVFAENNNGAEVGRNNAPLPPVDLGTPGSPSSPTPAAVAPPKSSNRALYIIGGVVLGLLVVLGMVVGLLYVKANAKQSRPVGRRRADWDDE